MSEAPRPPEHKLRQVPARVSVENGDYKTLAEAYANVAASVNAVLREFREELNALNTRLIVEFAKISNEIRLRRPKVDPKLETLERSASGHHLIMPVEEATELLARTKEAEELARYRWYKGTARDIAVHVAKTAVTVAFIGAVGWCAHAIFVSLSH